MVTTNSPQSASASALPQSSMLTLRVKQGEGIPRLDQHSFGLLLEESLGVDDHGQPNINDDADTNQKIIKVVLQVGIEPLLHAKPSDPFRKALSRQTSRIKQCIAVIKLAISRSPKVLYKVSEPQEEISLPVYAFLIPVLLSLLGHVDAREVQDALCDVLSTMLARNQHDAGSQTDVIWTFVLSCLSGLINAATRVAQSGSLDGLELNEQDFRDAVYLDTNCIIPACGSLRFENSSQLLKAACHLSSFLLKSTPGNCNSLRVRKQQVKLQRLLEELANGGQSNEKLEATRVDLEKVYFSSPPNGDSFGTSLDLEEWAESERAKKRPRLSEPDTDGHANGTIIHAIAKKATRVIIGRELPDFDGLSAIALTRFKTLSEDQQCLVVDTLGLAACWLQALSTDEEVDCSLCDEPDQTLGRQHTSCPEELLKTLIALKSVIQRRVKLRASALTALRRILNHSTTAAMLRLKSSPAGDLCLQSLRATHRDLRLASVAALQAYVRGGAERDPTVIHENRVTALESLEALWKSDETSVQEGVVVALANIATVANDEERNIILLRLTDYLGHRNTYITSLVYSELQQLAQNLQLRVAMMFWPFWRTVSIVVVKNFTRRPSVPQQLADLLGMPLDIMLQIMEEHALPWLVLNRETKLMQRVAMSGNTPRSLFDLCTQDKNLTRILSFLLAQAFPDPEQTIMALLLEISDDFRAQDLAGWVNLLPIQIACELLLAIGDAGSGKSSKTYHGLQLFSQLVLRKQQSVSASRRGDHTATFLESNALAIITYLTIKLNEAAVTEPHVEKRRSLIAVGEVVKLAKSRVKIALPQICACLRAALDDAALCNAAFSAWVTMMSNLGEDEFEQLVSQTFAVIVRVWDNLVSSMQDQAYNLIASILKDHEGLVREIFEELPSLGSIPLMAKFESEISTLKRQKDDRHQLVAFIDRLNDESEAVVEQAAHELVQVLRHKQDYVLKCILQEQPETFIKDLSRALLDVCAKFRQNTDLVNLGGQCLGLIGCLDPNKLESVREKKLFILTSNYAKADETTTFLMFFIENVLVPEYVSASSLLEKGFLAWSLQELLAFCALPADIAVRGRSGGLTGQEKYWFELSDMTRLVLTPFLTSRYKTQGKRQRHSVQYPHFKIGMTHKSWLTAVTLDFLTRGAGRNVEVIFDVCCRLVAYSQGTAIASFLLPYATLNLLLTGVESDKRDLETEVARVLQQTLAGLNLEQQDDIRQCSQSVFDVLDYMSMWLQETRKQAAVAKARAERGIKDLSPNDCLHQADTVAAFLGQVPAMVITQRSIECRSFSRALFHQEQYLMNQAALSDQDFRRLLDIYAQIDEPDGIEGISAQIKFLDVDSEVMEHKMAGRWATAQSWYEIKLVEHPDDIDVQTNLVNCLKASGQYDTLLHHFDGLSSVMENVKPLLLPFAIEAAWKTARWDKVATYLSQTDDEDFATDLARVMLATRQDEPQIVTSEKISHLVQTATRDITSNSTTSFQASHTLLLQMHAVGDITSLLNATAEDKERAFALVKKRLDVLGSYVGDKQYLLSIQRAIMQLRPDVFRNEDIADSWITTARLARKAQATQQAFTAVLRASALGDTSVTIEQAKLMWQQGHHRKAIQSLEGAIDSGVLGASTSVAGTNISGTAVGTTTRNFNAARAYVLLGKWLDQAGQTQSETIIKTFRKATQQNRKWEKGWYNLGRHYNKILDSEKQKPPGKESQHFLTGETSKLVIDNFLKTLVTGNRYLFQTLPKILTLWLEIAGGDELEHDTRRGNTQFHKHNSEQRRKVAEETNSTIKRYLDRLPAYTIYTVLSQLVARICHPDASINAILVAMIVKCVRAYPQQALWTVFASVKSSSKDRATRGHALLRKAMENPDRRGPKKTSTSELSDLITTGQKFAGELLRIADYEIQGRVSRVSLARDMGFNHKIAPTRLVVPCEACLIPNIPTDNEVTAAKGFRPFAREPVTISAFLDEARVLPSLQKPRKLSLRGSDGNIYNVLAKPHDDLRKDQRLLEFDNMIDRFLKRDINASKRRLYIRTYAVVPLNEECGLIEWVDGLKTMRDILLEMYKQRGISADYAAIREQLDSICGHSENKAKDFADKVQSQFPPMLRNWFVEHFPDPTAWFNARLRYTRTSAVMSVVGHVLGLGDRHGENILFEQGNGGVLHVDFNCLFDKGLTFEKPEMVPFRLTHNMIDAMGSYRYDGPFRRCCEITLQLLRNNEDAMMTILETFLHDPTTDFATVGKKRKNVSLNLGPGMAREVPDTPERMLEGVRGKVRGMLAGESVPLSVGGYVEWLIAQASDGANLARMYIGWCAFL